MAEFSFARKYGKWIDSEFQVRNQKDATNKSQFQHLPVIIYGQSRGIR